jgi:integrase
VKGYDVQRIAEINEAIGATPLIEIIPAWSAWIATRGWAPGTAARWRAVAQAALTHGAAAEAIAAPTLPGVAVPPEDRVVSLSPAERAALLRAYNPHAACPVLLLAYAGLRTQEALRLDWRDVDLSRGRLWIGRTKTGRGRMVPTHRRVELLLHGMREAAGRPSRGPVFLSARGEPYRDTTGLGGNPLTRAHLTACRLAGVTDFRLHDWRHDFATRFLAEGGDVRGLMQVMGWRQVRMVERYVTHKADHLAEVLRRVG